MSRDIAAAIRSEPAQLDSLNHVCSSARSRRRAAAAAIWTLRALLKIVSAHYDRIDAERRGIVRSMQLMSDEAQALTREIREQTASHLQAILDNVKDAIVTVDDTGHIETFNPTGERIFGYAPAEILGRSLEFLLPEIANGSGDFLERLATKIDDTHVDLAAHQTWGRAKGGNRVAVEIAVSKAKLNWRDGYIVSIRDITERHLAEQSMRESEARYRTLVEHAPEVIVVFDVDQGRFVDVNDNACRFFKMDRETLLASGPDKISPAQQSDGTLSFGRPRGFIEGALGRRGAGVRVDALRCRRPDPAVRSALRAPAEFQSAADPRQHHRYHRAQAGGGDCGGGAAGLREDRRQCAADDRARVDLRVDRARHVRQLLRRSACSIRNARRWISAPRPKLPRAFVTAMDSAPIGIRYGSCAAAVYLARQITVADIETDALWEYRREAARHAVVASRLVDAHRRLRRARRRYLCGLSPSAGHSAVEGSRVDVAHGADRRHRHRAPRRRGCVAQQRNRNFAGCSKA